MRHAVVLMGLLVAVAACGCNDKPRPAPPAPAPDGSQVASSGGGARDAGAAVSVTPKAPPLDVAPADPEPPTPVEPAPVPRPPDVEPQTPPSEVPASRLEQVGPYTADVGRDCDGEPALALTTAAGLCVGLPVHKDTAGIAGSRGRFRPRTLLEDPKADGVIWVVDAGAKRPKAGRVWRVERVGRSWKATAILSKLDRPHGSGVGPDGWIYVGEIHQIIRLDPAAADPAGTVEVVVSNLPTQLRDKDRIRYHPLTAFVFTPGWDLVVNMGSHTDRCLEALPADRCPDEVDHTAAIWKFAYQGAGKWTKAPEYLAHGLRNSVALAVHPSGTILQAENGSDFSSDDSPREELNIIRPGRHYGWPYCFDRRGRDPRWSGSSFACTSENKEYEPPHLLLPAHAAPLDLHYYGSGGLAGLRGKLLVSYHGYRATGHRLVALDVDDKGVPPKGAKPAEFVAGWAASDSGPKGGPVGMWRARDGALWVADDRNGTLLRVAADRFAASRIAADAKIRPVPPMDPGFEALWSGVFTRRCTRCHKFFGTDAAAAWAGLHREGWLDASDGPSRLAVALGPDTERPMPPDVPLSPEESARVRTWLGTLGGE